MQTSTGWILFRTQSIAPETSAGKANQAITRYVGSIDLVLSDNGGGHRAETARVTLISYKTRNAVSAPVHRFVRQRSLAARRTRTNTVHVVCSVADRRGIAKQDSRWQSIQSSTAQIRVLNVDREHDSNCSQQRNFESAKSAAHMTAQNIDRATDRAVDRRLALIVFELTNTRDHRDRVSRSGGGKMAKPTAVAQRHTVSGASHCS